MTATTPSTALVTVQPAFTDSEPVNQGLDAVKDPVAVEQELLLLMEALGVAS
jgi:hypothetical protein